MAVSAEAAPPARLFPKDFEILLKLLPRAQIVVGDIPNILPTLQRLEAALLSRTSFTEDRPVGPVESGDKP